MSRTTTTHPALRHLAAIRDEYARARAIFITGATMVEILSELGATDDDLAAIPGTSENLAEDPTLPFRRSRNGRFVIDFQADEIRRAEFQPFVLSVEEDFVRHDSGQVRRFSQIEQDLQGNSAFQALLVFKALVIRDVEVTARPRLDYGAPEWISTAFHLRTVTMPTLLGEPALEGVHTDGVDHTMTTFLGARNVTDDSARTFMHHMDQPSGVRWHEVDPGLVMGQVQHRSFLDTLLVVDNERKHSVTPVEALDPRAPATRDMLIFFTRKPVEKGHVSHPYDSLRPHADLPLTIPVGAVAREDR